MNEKETQLDLHEFFIDTREKGVIRTYINGQFDNFYKDYDTYNKTKNKLKKYQKQLQAYKDKEDRLRVELENFHTQFETDETISSHHLKSKKEILEIARQQIKNCLQILNEGSDK